MKEPAGHYSVSVADLDRPVILERDGEPMAVLISIEEYERYRALMAERQAVTAEEARGAADRAVFGDLVGCAVASGIPEWVSTPEPHWRVPYRTFGGRLLKTVDVDARTATVSLTVEERGELLERVERLVANANGST